MYLINFVLYHFTVEPPCFCGTNRKPLKSLLGEFRYKVCCPVSRRLVTSQKDSVKRYNEIVREHFEVHRIVARMDAVDKMTKYCGNPSPRCLRSMIIKLYKQMTEIRIHAEKKCRKILRPESDFSPTV